MYDPLGRIIEYPEVMRMGYRILYGPEISRYCNNRRDKKRLWGMTLGCLLLFLALTMQLWPEGRAVLENMLLPGDPAVTKQAFSVMTEQLQSGEAIADAAAAFCQEVLDGAEAAP